MTKNVMKYGNMGIKRTVSTRQVSPGLLASINKSKNFQKIQKTKISIFPLYFSANSFEKCRLNWGGERLIGFD